MVSKNLTIDAFHTWVNTELLPSLIGLQSVHRILRSTAHTWLGKLGFKYKTAKKGVCVDHHGHSNVIKFRNDVFLPNMAEVEQCSFHYVGVVKGSAEMDVSSEHVHSFRWTASNGIGPEELDHTKLGPFGGPINPSLMLPCGRPVMLVVQDETLVCQNDCRKSYWRTDEMHLLLPKKLMAEA